MQAVIDTMVKVSEWFGKLEGGGWRRRGGGGRAAAAVAI